MFIVALAETGNHSKTGKQVKTWGTTSIPETI